MTARIKTTRIWNAALQNRCLDALPDDIVEAVEAGEIRASSALFNFLQLKAQSREPEEIEAALRSLAVLCVELNAVVEQFQKAAFESLRSPSPMARFHAVRAIHTASRVFSDTERQQFRRALCELQCKESKDYVITALHCCRV